MSVPTVFTTSIFLLLSFVALVNLSLSFVIRRRSRFPANVKHNGATICDLCRFIEGYRCPVHCEDLSLNKQHLLVGQALNVTCKINCDNPRVNNKTTTGPYKCNSTWMYLKHKSLVLNTTVLDDQTIQFFLDNVTVDFHETPLQCYLNSTGMTGAKKSMYLGSQVPKVRELPKIDNINCTFLNWEQATCRWCEEKGNVAWSVTYTDVNNPASSGSKECPKKADCSITWNDKCFHKTDEFNITVNASIHNFGSVSYWSSIDFYNKSLIVPDAPQVKEIIQNSRSLLVKFEGPLHLAGLTDLNYSIQIHSEYLKTSVEPVFIRDDGRNRMVMNHTYTDLIPFTNYTISVKVQAIGSQYWGEAAVTHVMTLSDVPSANPETRPSSFIYDNDRKTLKTYYKDIPKKYTNGEILSAIGRLMPGNSPPVNCNYHEDRVCTFNGTDLKTNVSIEIRGHTVNGSGPARPTSVLTIPKYGQGARPPEYFAGEIKKEPTANLTVVNFVWKNVDNQSVDNHVLYYRHNKQQNIYQGGVGWEVLNGSSESAEVNITHGAGKSLSDYQFAIASETNQQSAGIGVLGWQKCLFKVDGTFPKLPELKENEKNKTKTSFVLEWDAQHCVPGMRRIKSYVLTVWNTTSDGTRHRQIRNQIILAVQMKFSVRVTSLSPGTKYKVVLEIQPDNNKIQTLEVITSRTDPVLTPAVIATIIIVFLIVIGLVIFAIWRFYRKVNNDKNQLSIMRTEAAIEPAELAEGCKDEYYVIPAENPRPERSASESSSSDGDHGSNKELHRLIPNGRPANSLHPRRLMSHESAGSGHSAMTDVTYLPSESDSEEMFQAESPRSLGHLSHGTDLQPVPEVAEEGKRSSPEHEYSSLKDNTHTEDVFIDFADGHPRGRFVSASARNAGPPVAGNPRPGPRVYSRPSHPPVHLLPRPEPRAHSEPRSVKFQNPAGKAGTKSTDPKKGARKEPESACGGSSDDEYCKLAAAGARVSPEKDLEGYLVPNLAPELDEEGYTKPKSSSGESRSDQEQKTPPPTLILRDHDFGQSSSSDSDDSDDEDCYAKVHHDPVLGPGGYVQRFEPSPPRNSQQRKFTPIELGAGGYCTIDMKNNSKPPDSGDRNHEVPILNLPTNNQRELTNSAQSVPPETNSRFSSGPVGTPKDNSGQSASVDGPVTSNGYVLHGDAPSVLGQTPANPVGRGFLGIPGEFDSEDDSSTLSLSDSGVHSSGETAPISLAAPMANGYVVRPDQVQDQTSITGSSKDTSNTSGNSGPVNQNYVHSRPNCVKSLPNGVPNGIGYNVNNSNSNVSSDYVQSMLPEITDNSPGGDVNTNCADTSEPDGASGDCEKCARDTEEKVPTENSTKPEAASKVEEPEANVQVNSNEDEENGDGVSEEHNGRDVESGVAGSSSDNPQPNVQGLSGYVTAEDLHVC